MRLFTALDLPQDTLLRLERLIAGLRREALIKWSPLDNLHITTKFIGEWQESRLDELRNALLEAAPREAFDVEISGLGWFPNERAPRVLWAGIAPSEGLTQLAHDTEACLAKLGVAREERPFAPHLTLARIKNPVPLGALRQRVTEMKLPKIGAFRATEFSLFRSDPGSNASIYRKLGEYGFAASLAAAGAAQ